MGSFCPERHRALKNHNQEQPQKVPSDIIVDENKFMGDTKNGMYQEVNQHMEERLESPRISTRKVMAGGKLLTPSICMLSGWGSRLLKNQKGAWRQPALNPLTCDTEEPCG